MWRLTWVWLVCACLWSAVPAHAERAHRVASGQTLSGVAKRYGVSVYDLSAHNKLRLGAPLRLGQLLYVPPRGIVYVRPGQTLSHVARDHHCSIEALRRANGMREREPLKAGQRLRLPGFVPSPDKDWGKPEQPGVVTIVQDGAARAVRLVDAEGRVSRRGLTQLGQAMAGRGSAAERHAHPRLALLLAMISDHFGGRSIQIVSGFRAVGGYTSDGSRHVVGRAADIEVRGVPRAAVWEYCRTLKGAGCGFYPNSVFTHVDARRTRTQWVDWSRPGKRARYGTLRGPTRNRARRRRMEYLEVGGEVPLTVTIVEDAYVALDDAGRPLSLPKLTTLDDRTLDPRQDWDIAERALPDWARVACMAPVHAWVPFTSERAPRLP